jgi:ATP-binding cassette, subfamily C (CFTR/MRP), member 1
VISILLLSVLTSATQLLPTFWLSIWTTKDQTEQRKKKYPLIFAGVVLLYTILSLVRAGFLLKVILKSNSNMLSRITERVIHAKVIFFDSNPIGRILTRFTKDLVGLDFMLPT